jgi:hypothetical protein
MPTKNHRLKANPRRPGAQRGEVADCPRKADQNFKQSCDLREDRGARQIKFATRRTRLGLARQNTRD